MTDGPQFFDPSDPQSVQSFMAQQQAQHEQYHMRLTDFSNRIRSLLLRELSFDQLKTIAEVLNLIADSHNPGALANFYEGMAAMAVGAREDEVGQFETLHLGGELRHDFVESVDDLDDPNCAAPNCGLPPASRVHGGTE